MMTGEQLYRDEFDAATEYFSKLVTNGSVDERVVLKFYGYFKQATEGPCEDPKPGIFDVKGRAKWSAWSALGSLESDQARRLYIELLTSIKPDWNIDNTHDSNRSLGGGPVFSSLAHGDEDEMYSDDESDDNVLIDAASRGDIATIQQAVASGLASLDSRDSQGCTALHWAADRGKIDAMVALLEAGTNIDSIDLDGQTSLHYAACAEQKLAAQLLLEAGADSSIESFNGERAIDLAPPEWRDSVFSTNFRKNKQNGGQVKGV